MDNRIAKICQDISKTLIEVAKDGLTNPSNVTDVFCGVTGIVEAEIATRIRAAKKAGQLEQVEHYEEKLRRVNAAWSAYMSTR